MNHKYLLEYAYGSAREHLRKYVQVFNTMVIPFMRNFAIDDEATIKKFILDPDFVKMREYLIEREANRSSIGREYAAMLIDNMLKKYFDEHKPLRCYVKEHKESGLMIPLVPASPGNSGDTQTLVVDKDEEGRNIIAINDAALRKMHTKTLCDEEQRFYEILKRFADEMNEAGYGGRYLPDLFDQDNGKMRVRIYNR